jgi:hypothetical protein
MSENPALVRSILAAWEGGELMADEWSENAHPEIELVVVGGPEPRG